MVKEGACIEGTQLSQVIKYNNILHGSSLNYQSMEFAIWFNAPRESNVIFSHRLQTRGIVSCKELFKEGTTYSKILKIISSGRSMICDGLKGISDLDI